MNILNKLATAVACSVVLSGFLSLQAYACGGNDCTYESGGGGQSNGWYDANGVGYNNATGNITNRGSMAESYGQVEMNTSFSADTCNTSDCALNNATSSGLSTVMQRSGSFIYSDGGHAETSANGTAGSGYDVSSFSWNRTIVSE